jgi:hypothetical protein
MNIQHLTPLLAERVMGWGVAADRFLLGNRRWIVRRRFQPTVRIEDAFRLLEKAEPEQCMMGFRGSGTFRVTIRVNGTTVEACEASKPLAISLAVARALKIEVDL